MVFCFTQGFILCFSENFYTRTIANSSKITDYFTPIVEFQAWGTILRTSFCRLVFSEVTFERKKNFI